MTLPTWNIEPYRFLKELETRYVRVTVQVTRKGAYDVAAEAEEWMKQHAPWTDRTLNERMGFFNKRYGKLAAKRMYKTLDPRIRGARAGLRVIVKEDDAAERAAYGVGLSKARTQESRILAKENKQRVEQGKIPLAKVPKSRSPVEAFKKEARATRFPLVELLFTHNKNIRYAIWLEIANQGRYAIIAPAIDYWGPKFMQKIKGLNNLIQYKGMFAFDEPKSTGEQFLDYASERTQASGKPYQPWGSEMKRVRKRNRKYYRPQEYRDFIDTSVVRTRKDDFAGIKVFRPGIRR